MIEDPAELEDVDAFAQSIWDTIPDTDLHELDIEEVPDNEICFVTAFNSEAKEPDNVDTYEDLVTFVQPMTDVLDEA
jgi:hypothetical protein